MHKVTSGNLHYGVATPGDPDFEELRLQLAGKLPMLNGFTADDAVPFAQQGFMASRVLRTVKDKLRPGTADPAFTHLDPIVPYIEERDYATYHALKEQGVQPFNVQQLQLMAMFIVAEVIEAYGVQPPAGR